MLTKKPASFSTWAMGRQPLNSAGISRPFGALIIVASNASVYTEACLLVANRPQTPVKPGAGAPGFLSRLRRLLLPAGREKSSSRLLLTVTTFLFFGHAQNPIHIIFGGAQFYHFVPCLLVR